MKNMKVHFHNHLSTKSNVRKKDVLSSQSERGNGPFAFILTCDRLVLNPPADLFFSSKDTGRNVTSAHKKVNC
jgi:hypothetical protein